MSWSYLNTVPFVKMFRSCSEYVGYVGSWWILGGSQPDPTCCILSPMECYTTGTMIQFSEVESEQSYLNILRLYQLLQRKLKYSFNTSQPTTLGFSHPSCGCFLRLPSQWIVSGPYGQTDAQRRNANVWQLIMWRFCFLRSWEQKSFAWTLRFQFGWSVFPFN